MIQQDNLQFVDRPIAFVSPSTAAGAVQLLHEWAGAARIIAGGTDLMLELERSKTGIHCLVSTDQIRDLKDISMDDEYVQIGAAVTFSAIRSHPYLQHRVHVLVEAARSVGCMGIQNVATLAGNIVNAMPAADGAIAAIALEAEVHILSVDHAEWRPVESLFLGPGASLVDPTSQLITQIRFRRCGQAQGTAWGRIARRPSLTLPILNCAVNIHLDRGGQKIERARVALGPVGPRPFRAFQAEQFLEGMPWQAENLARAAQIAQQESDPRGNVLRASREYRLAAIPGMVENALLCAVQRACASAEGSAG